MKVKATAHIKSDRSEFRMEVWDADHMGDGSGLSVDLRMQLKERGYVDTGNCVTGMRLTAPANKAKEEAGWLATQGIGFQAGHTY